MSETNNTTWNVPKTVREGDLVKCVFYQGRPAIGVDVMKPGWFALVLGPHPKIVMHWELVDIDGNRYIEPLYVLNSYYEVLQSVLLSGVEG